MGAHEIDAIQGETVTLRPPVETDVPRLAAILGDPAVAVWWGAWDEARTRKEFVDPGDESVPWAIEVEGAVVGLVQYYEETEPMYRHASIDIFVDPAWHGRGIGADAVRTLARYLFEERGHHRLTIDPAAHNERAIRAYRRVGFKPVGVLRQYERGLNGTFHDGLLMDLLRDELT